LLYNESLIISKKAQASIPQLVLMKELMVGLVDDEEAYGECGK